MKRLLLVIIALLIIGLLHNMESNYCRKAIVTENNNNIVTCVDTQGYIWEYRGQAKVGDKVTLMMNDNHTSDITDDIIRGVR